jgi:CRISPR-associated protein Csm3
MMKRTEIVTIEGRLECLSGLRIGGSQDDLEIGGLDLPVIKHPDGTPYLPGSSLKGRMRSEIERMEGRYSGNQDNEPCGCAKEDCPVCRVFGPHKNTRSELGPTRIIVRDAPLLEPAELETKTENVINRKTGAAEHPRTLERVTPGAKFGIRIDLQVFDKDRDFPYGSKTGKDALLTVVSKALHSVEATGLGSGVSRGSGHIAFKDLKLNGSPWTWY